MLTFYSSFFAGTFALTLVCAALCYMFSTQAMVFIFWFKVSTSGIAASYINTYKQKEFLYYQNLGISKALLWVSTLGFDMALFTFFISLLIKLK